ncbi:MAG: COX15/CtaA family protein [Candidatus Dormibacteraceae bacterium]
MAGVTLFRRLAVVTAIFAYLQIALGGVVRVSGSGLGCPDWPLCHGRPYPPANLNSIIEYSHRAVGSVTELLITATAILAWVVWRSRRPLVAWLATASLVAGLGEALLGAGVVANELASWLVLIHLSLAMIILGFLVATALMSMPPSPGVADPSFRRLVAIAAAATYLLLLTGSTVVASGADTACRSWPLCGAGFTPDFTGVNAFTMLHRGSVLVVGVLLVFALLRAARRQGLRAASIATLAVFVVQVAVGAGAAVTDGALFNGFHVALATLVWAGVLTTALLTLPRADRNVLPSRMIVEKGSA